MGVTFTSTDGQVTFTAAVAGPQGPVGGVIDGGTTGQVLAKASNVDQDTEWITIVGGGGGGTGDVVGPASATDGRAVLFDGTTGKLVKQASAAPMLVGDAPTAHVHAGTDITTGLVAASVLGTGGDGAGAKYLADDQTFKTPPAIGAVLSDVVLTGTQTTISFTAIASTYAHLIIVYQARSNEAGITNTQLRMRVNNDTGSNYNSQFVGGNNTTAYGQVQSGTAFGYLGDIPAAAATSGYSSSGTIEIPNYPGTTFFKNALFATTRDTNGAGVNMVAYRGHIVWKSTSALSRVDLFCQYGDFIAGSRFTLYGINGA